MKKETRLAKEKFEKITKVESVRFSSCPGSMRDMFSVYLPDTAEVQKFADNYYEEKKAGIESPVFNGLPIRFYDGKRKSGYHFYVESKELI